jgi:hypothetical protein
MRYHTTPDNYWGHTYETDEDGDVWLFDVDSYYEPRLMVMYHPDDRHLYHRISISAWSSGGGYYYMSSGEAIRIAKKIRGLLFSDRRYTNYIEFNPIKDGDRGMVKIAFSNETDSEDDMINIYLRVVPPEGKTKFVNMTYDARYVAGLIQAIERAAAMDKRDH